MATPGNNASKQPLSFTQTPMSPARPEYLHVIPVDIWILCWALCSRRQLHRLSLVCKLFHSICLPLLFRDQHLAVGLLSQNISAENWIPRVRHLHRTAVRLDKLVEHASLVHSWKTTFLGSSTCLARWHPHLKTIHLFDRVYVRLIATFSTTLGQYRNLRSLELGHFTLTQPFQDTLVLLQILEELTLRSSTIIPYNILLPLLCFTESNTRGKAKPLRMVSPQTIQTLNVDGGRPLFISLFAGFTSEPLIHNTFLRPETPLRLRILCLP